MNGTTLLISFEVDNLVEVTNTQIKTLSTENGIEYLITTEDKRIRLDYIHIIEEQSK